MFSISRDKKPGEYTAGDAIRVTIQTLNKLARDWGITADKIIMIYDKWDKELGGYITTSMLKGCYKDDRGDIEGKKGLDAYMTKEKYEEMKNDPDVSQADLEEAEKKLYFNTVKYDAKWGMVKDLANFGVPSLGVDGWEYDNLAWLAAGLLYNPNDKPSIIVTKDSDLQYALTPKMDYFRLPTHGSQPQIITYDEMYNSIPDPLKGKLSLYDYKSYLDAMGEGHNGMRKTRKDRVSPIDVIQHVMAGDYSDLDDVDLFKTQLSTFDISKFPRFNEAKRVVTDLFGTCGKLGSVVQFHEFCKKYGITEISDQYFITFISRFDPELYTND